VALYITLLFEFHSQPVCIVERYLLTYTTDIDTGSPVVLYDGLSLSTPSDKLSPYTNYSFSVSACTSGGCLDSAPVWVITPQAAPSGQRDPEIIALTSDSLYVEWQPPTHPNGMRFQLLHFLDHKF